MICWKVSFLKYLISRFKDFCLVIVSFNKELTYRNVTMSFSFGDMQYLIASSLGFKSFSTQSYKKSKEATDILK